MSLLKKILLVVVILAVALFAAAVAAYKFVGDKYIESQALKALQNGINRKVTIDGEFKLSRSLHPILRATNVRIASADWDPQPYMIEADKFQIGVDLLDLLRGVVTIENLVFSNTTFNILLNRNGVSNLEFGNTNKTSENQAPVSYVDVADVELINVRINYVDEQKQQKIEFKFDDFKADALSKHKINLTANSTLNDREIKIASTMCRIRQLVRGDDCQITAKVISAPFESHIEGTLNTQGNTNQLHVKTKGSDITELNLPIDVPLPTIRVIQAQFNLSGPLASLRLSELEGEVELIDTRIALHGEVTSITPLRGANFSIDVSGTHPEWLDAYQEVFPSKLIDQFAISAKIINETEHWKIFDLDAKVAIDKSTLATQGEVIVGTELLNVALAATIEGTDPEWLNSLQEVIAAEQIDKFSLQANITNPDNVWSVNNIVASLTADNNILSAQGAATYTVETGPTIDVTVTALGDNLQNFEPVFKQVLPSSEQFSINSTVNLKQSVLSLNSLKVKVDDTQLEGTSVIEFSSPPNIQAKLQAESINAEHIIKLFPASVSEDAESSAKKSDEAAPLFTDDPISFDWLKTANADISLKINELIYKDATLNAVHADVTAKNNQATFELTSLQYQDAILRSSVAIDANNKQFTYNLYTEAFDLGKLLKEIDVSTTLNGKIDASINLAANGNTSQQIATNTNGKITAIMTEGSLADAPIDLLASNLLVELMPGRSKTDNTKIECMFMQLSGTDGVFNTDAVMLNTENIVMTADGSIDLTQEMLNFVLIPKPKDIELFTLDANIRVKGDITDPSFSLDKGSLFKKLLKSAATIALGPAATLAIPFASMGTDKTAKCFSEVADATTRAVEAQEEAERKAKEEAERKAKEAAANEDAETPKKATVESLDL